jgi:hypothetical protein
LRSFWLRREGINGWVGLMEVVYDWATWKLSTIVLGHWTASLGLFVTVRLVACSGVELGGLEV